MLSNEKQKAIIEGMMFVSTQPVPLSKMVRKLRKIARQWVKQAGEEDDCETVSDNILKQLMDKQEELEQEITNSDVKALLKEIEDSLIHEDRGIELVTVAKGYQFRTKYEISLHLKDEKVQTPSRFSPSSLETLAIIAYQQPVTRQKIEEIRGVDSGGVIKTLLEKSILRVIGRSDEPGKPLIYGTSKKFLEIFSLTGLKDLPSLQDYHSLQISQDKDQFAKQAGEMREIKVDDLIEDGLMDMSEVEEEALTDLTESLKHLKQVEKEIGEKEEGRGERDEATGEGDRGTEDGEE